MKPTTAKTPTQLETRDAPPLTVRAAVVPASVDEKERTVDVTWSTGAEVVRRDWFTETRYVEALSMQPKHVRLGRLNAGAPVLDSHSSYRVASVLGVVERAKLEQGQGVATIRFSERAEVEPVWKDVLAGILRNVSVGYIVHRWDVKKGEGKELERRTAVDWEPYELSLVPIPADHGAQVRAYDDNASGDEPGQADNTRGRGAEETVSMSDQQRSETAPAPAAPAPAAPAPAAVPHPTADEVRAAERALERKRAAAIDELCSLHGVSAERRAAWLGGDVTVDAVRSAILDEIGERQRATRVSPVALAPAGGREAEMRRDASDALLVRAGVEVKGDGWRNFGDGSLLRMAERVLEAHGVNTRTMSRDELAKRALATTDFGDIFGTVGTRLMRKGYESVDLVHRRIFRKATASDFKARTSINVSAGEPLEEVPEGGRIQHGKVSREMASYALKTYGKIIGITRQLIINDDFDFVARVSEQRGRAAAETERKAVWDYIKSNPVMPDGVPLFDAAHGNYATAASNAAVSAAVLTTARAALRNQTSTDGIALNAVMRNIVTGTALEVTFDQLLNGTYTPTTPAAAIAPTLRTSTLFVEPMVPGQDWYGFADYNQIDTIEYAYLAGNEGPRMEQRVGFEIEGIELKVALDFGVGAIDWRGMYWLNGAAS